MEKQLTVQELKDLEFIQTEMDKLTVQYGQIMMNKKYIYLQEKELDIEFNSLNESNSIFQQRLIDKYGNGYINMEMKTFVLINK